LMEGARIKTLIVDDEPLACRKIRRLLRSDTDVEVIGECSNGQEALRAIEEHTPDLIFLDVQMPGMDGFALLDSLDSRAAPMVIFVTAYDQYALRAFDFCALDYLLKPFDRQRFERALQRAKARIRSTKGGEINHRTLELLEEIRARSSYTDRIVIKSGGRVFFLKTEEIDWVEAEGKYVRLHVGKESYLLRETIGGLEAQLDPKKFLRIHRCRIVNIDRIEQLEPWFHNEYRVVLRDGTHLMLSRSCRKRLSELLGGAL
jgi:two-component system, LytTR family, response regulator